jgi:hypothetical protein
MSAMGIKEDVHRRLEAAIRALTEPVDGQYPRPWMTSMVNPEAARVFTVGKNQAKKYPIAEVGSHDHYLDALFNRGAESCRGLYDRLYPDPSRTRMNTDVLVQKLAERGISDVLETNVICFSTPMSADLRRNENLRGAKRGREIFSALYEIIRPRVIIAHGAGTIKELTRFFGIELASPPDASEPPVISDLGALKVFSIPSLAPPGFNKWQRWSNTYLDDVATVAAAIIKSEEI